MGDRGKSNDKQEKSKAFSPNSNERDGYGGAVVDSDRVLGLSREYSGWDVYNNEAKKVDTELVKDWTASLNSLLLFAAIFAAVLTAFIIESKKLLEQDPMAVLVDVMIFHTNNVANGTHQIYTPRTFIASPSAITINSLFFSSLSISLIAALASVVALQWVANYDAAITRGGFSPEDRAKRREFRHAGVLWWKMGEIIAALPLLLYGSVVLFLTGLILWMYLVHYVVGIVVAGGTAVAVSFHAISTLVATMFVSAPFRTPLSHWVYTLIHFPFSVAYLLTRRIQTSTPPAWLENKHARYSTSDKRENIAVEVAGGLRRDALIWLANQLSLSQESYRRLLLLADELTRLKPEHLPRFDSAEVPWYSILDLLGWNCLTKTRGDVTFEDRRAFVILQQLSNIPGVISLIQPTTGYQSSPFSRAYWSQYSDLATGGTWSLARSRPNALFLLLRDIPNSSSGSEPEVDAMMQLSRWRNSQTKSSLIWKEVFSSAGTFPPEFFDSCVKTFSLFTRHHGIFVANPAEDRALISIISDITRIGIGRGEVGLSTAFSLIQAYESLFGYYWAVEEVNAACISKPLQYARNLQRRPSDEHTLHENFILMLSSQLPLYPRSERSMRIDEIVTMLWIRASNPSPRNWEGLIKKFGSDIPMMRLRGSIPMYWIENVAGIPHILTILQKLAESQAETPEASPLWRARIETQGKDPQFVEAMNSFDILMNQQCSPAEHCMLVDLMCHDLELEPAPDFEGYFTPSRLASLSELRDPCLQTIVNSVRGTDFMKPVYGPERDKVRASWDRIQRYLLKKYPSSGSPTVLQLQASLWPMVYDHQQFYLAALRKPHILSRIQRMFEYPVRCASGCIDGPSHLLVHLLSSVLLKEFPQRLRSFTEVHLHEPYFPGSLILLYIWPAERRLPLQDYIGPSYGSLPQLDIILRDIQYSRYHALSMIYNVVSLTFQHVGDIPEFLAVVTFSIAKALELPYEENSIYLLAPMAHMVLRLRDKLLAYGSGSPADRDASLDKAINTHELLIRSLASKFVFGGQNNSVLVCARAQGNIAPAAGRLLPYLA